MADFEFSAFTKKDALSAGLEPEPFDFTAFKPATNPQSIFNAREGAAGNPDTYATARSLAGQTGLPTPTVERNLEEIKLEQRVAAERKLMDDNPAYARKMLDPDFAKVSAGDGPALTQAEQISGVVRNTRGPAPTLYNAVNGVLWGKPFMTSVQQFVQARRLQFAHLFGKDEMALDATRKAARIENERTAYTPEFESTTANAAYGGLQSLAQQAPLMLAGGGKAAFPLMAAGVSAGDESYLRLTAKGIPAPIAYIASQGVGFAELLGEAVPMMYVMQKFGKETVAKFLVNWFKQEGLGEQATTLAQDAIDVAVGDPSTDKPKTWGDYLRERPQRAYETLVATAAQTAAMGSAHAAVRYVKGRDGEAEQATRHAEAITQLMDISREMPTRLRAPSTYAAFVQEANPEGAVYVDATMFAQAALKAGVDITKAMPETAAAMTDALNTRSDVRIPLGELAATLPGTTMEQEVIPHIRVDLNAPTQAELTDKKYAEETQARVERILKEQEFDDTWKASAANVQKELLLQMNNANRFTPDVNTVNASVAAAMYATQAYRFRLTPEQLDAIPEERRAESQWRVNLTPEGMAARYPLNITNRSADGSFSLTQDKQPAAAINVGLAVGQADTATAGITQADIVAALKEMGVTATQIKEHDVTHKYGTERTAVVYLSRALTPDEMERLSATLRQDAIPQYTNGEGKLHGPKAPDYGDFDPELFFNADGKPISATGGLLQAALSANVSVRAQQPDALPPVRGVHYSNATGIKTLESNRSGTGILGAEQQRLKYSKDENIKKRVYLYEAPDAAVMPQREVGLGPHAYEATLANLYDFTTDPRGILAEVRSVLNSDDRANALESAVAREGFDGYKNRNMIVMLGVDVPVSRVENVAFNQPVLPVQDFMEHLTPTELSVMKRALADKIVAHMKNFPDTKETAAVAFAGRAKRGWYKESARAISDVFGPDAPQFALLLASLSPQTSVESNLTNTLNVWVKWNEAGRPREREAIIDVLAAGVQGDGTRNSVLSAWTANAVRALQYDEDVINTRLSGAKVNSFYRNLIGDVDEVTNDTWMANYALVSQKIFDEGAHVPMRGKGAGYLAMNAHVRAVAKELTELTGETWTPAEVQETVWSWAKSLYEMASVDRSAEDIIRAGDLTHEVVNSTPDFSSLFTSPRYADILKEAGYDNEITTLRSRRADIGRQPGEDNASVASEAAPFNSKTQRRFEIAAAKRLDKLRAGDTLSQKIDQTETPAFRKWFGDSKVVDANGNPLVVYHNTTYGDFDTFQKSEQRNGVAGFAFYFSDAEGSNIYAQHAAKFKLPKSFDGQDKKINTMPVYLSMKNPLVVGDMRDVQQYARGDVKKAFGVGRRFAGISDTEQGALEKQGYDGVIGVEYVIREKDGSLSVAAKDTGGAVAHPVYVVFEPTQIKSAIGNGGTFDANDPSILSQAGEARGQITFSPAGVQQTSQLALLANANLSTFHHEMGHFYLEVLTDMASQVDAPADVVGDFNIAMKWFGLTPDQWNSMTLEQRRPYHEQWARGYEAYLFEGKSPSVELQQLFQRFRSWMLSVYRFLTGGDKDSSNMQAKYAERAGEPLLQLTDEVRGVMDRMLATNDAIMEAEAARNMTPLFGVKPADATEDAWKEYQALGADATQEAVDLLQTRSLRDMKYLSNARSAVLKKLEAEANTQRKAVRAEVAAEVRAEPVFQALRFLRTGKLINPQGVEVKTDGSYKLDAGVVQEMYDPASGNAGSMPDLSRIQGLTAKTGLHPDTAASILNFPSGDALIRALIEAGSPQDKIDGVTDQRMIERYGDLADQQGMEAAADEAVHNEVRARFVATELHMLEKATGQRRTLIAAAKEFAAKMIGQQKIRDIRPYVYAAAEARAARAAEAAMKPKAASGGGKTGPRTEPGRTTDNLPEAAAHKRAQLVNGYATREAHAALKEVAKGVAEMRRVLRGDAATLAKTRDVDVVMAARAILAEYGIGTRGESAQHYLEAVKEHDPAMYDVLRDRVDTLTQAAASYPQSKLPLYMEMPLEDFRGLRDEIAALMHLARRSRQMEVDGDLMDRQDVQQELRDRMEVIGIPDKAPGQDRAVTQAERRVAMIQSARAALRRVESWVGAKDGSKGMGPFRRYIWQQVKDAADAYRTDKAVYLKKYHALLDAVAPTLKPERIEAPELGYTFGYSRGGSGTQEILHAILHTGNESNMRKLLLGRQWATDNGDGTIDTTKWDAFIARMIAEGRITKAHYDFAQGVWDLLEAMKPAAQKTHRDVFGYYFNEVTAKAFVTPFGAYAGGYVPAVADSEIVTDAKTRALMEDENSSLQFAFPSTSKGFTKSRVEYNRPLLLDLRFISQHMDKVLLFSHLEQPIRDVRRVLTSKQVGPALNKIDPAALDGMITPWLNRTAKQQVEAPVAGSGGLMRFFSVARSRAGMAAMFANLSNTVQQVTGLGTAAVKVPPKQLLHALADAVVSPRDFNRAVADASPYMALRMENEIAQMAEEINDILLNPSVYEKAQAWTQRHAYFLQSAVDNIISPVVWTGAYNAALEKGVDAKDAVRLADGVVRETQGAMLPEEVSRIESGNAFVRMFTQFAGYFNGQANMLGTAFAQNAQELGLKKGAGRAFYIMLFGFLAPAWASEFIAQLFKGGPDDDDKDGEYLDDWLAAVFGFGTLRYGTAMIPGVGQAVNAAVNTFNSKPYDDRISTAPAVSMIESAVRSPMSVYKAIAEDGKPGKAVKDVATLLSMVTGLPFYAAARPVGYAADVSAGKVSPTSAVDAVRGGVTGTANPESKQ